MCTSCVAGRVMATQATQSALPQSSLLPGCPPHQLCGGRGYWVVSALSTGSFAARQPLPHPSMLAIYGPAFFVGSVCAHTQRRGVCESQARSAPPLSSGETVPLTPGARGGCQEDDEDVAERPEAAAAAGGGAASGVTARRSLDTGTTTPYGGPLVEQLNSITSSLRRGFKVGEDRFPGALEATIRLEWVCGCPALLSCHPNATITTAGLYVCPQSASLRSNPPAILVATYAPRTHFFDASYTRTASTIRCPDWMSKRESMGAVRMALHRTCWAIPLVPPTP